MATSAGSTRRRHIRGTHSGKLIRGTHSGDFLHHQPLGFGESCTSLTPETNTPTHGDRSGNLFRKLIQETHSGDSFRRFSPESDLRIRGAGGGEHMQGAHSGDSLRQLIQETHSGDSFRRFSPESAPGLRRFVHELDSRDHDPLPGDRSGNSFRKLIQETHSGDFLQNPACEFGGTGSGSTCRGHVRETHSGDSFRRIIQGISP